MIDPQPIKQPFPFIEEATARDILEMMRWGMNGTPVCPHCQCPKSYRIMNHKEGKRRGFKCVQCRKRYTVATGTVLESTHLPYSKCLYLIFHGILSDTEVPMLQLAQEAGITYKSAHDITHALRGSKPKSIKRRHQKAPGLDLFVWSREEDHIAIDNWKKGRDITHALKRTQQEVEERLEYLFETHEDGVIPA